MRTRVHYIGGSKPYQAVYFHPEIGVWFDIGDPKRTTEEARASEREFHARRAHETDEGRG